jgi:hypothetical protein
MKGRFRFHYANNIGLSPQTKMHVTVDESRDDHEATAVDTDGTFWDRDRPTRAHGCDLRAAHKQGGLVEQDSGPIDKSCAMDRDSHDLGLPL